MKGWLKKEQSFKKNASRGTYYPSHEINAINYGAEEPDFEYDPFYEE